MPQKSPNSIDLAAYQAFIDNIYSYRQRTHQLVNLISYVSFIFQYDDSALRFNSDIGINKLWDLAKQYQINYLDEVDELKYLTPQDLDQLFVQMMQIATVYTQYQYIHVPKLNNPVTTLIDIKLATRRAIKTATYNAMDQHKLTYGEILDSYLAFIGYDDEPELHQLDLPTRIMRLEKMFKKKYPYLDLDLYMEHTDEIDAFVKQDQVTPTDQYLITHWVVKNS